MNGARYIKDQYLVYFKGERIGSLYLFTDGSSAYNFWISSEAEPISEEITAAGITKSLESKKMIPRFARIIKDENRLPGTRKQIYKEGELSIERIPKDAAKFWIYRCSAEEGEEGFSEKNHSAPHIEGEKTPKGMEEWCTWYCFNKKDDGMYEAELDEAWHWGGSHNDGGTIRTEVPEEWLSLDYRGFLEKIITLSSAKHYGFTAEDLEKKAGLKEFFGFG